MVRPKHCRQVDSLPGNTYFKPRGTPLHLLEEVILTVDEFEALRLADLEGFYQEQAAVKMGVSRQTFGRIIKSAHRKVTEVLVRGKALKIEGGAFETAPPRKFLCPVCRHAWDLPCGKERPESCPSCKNMNIHKDPENKENDSVGQSPDGQGTQQK